ncbi:hypothetical protein MTO96_036749, partial [Rhipicephalus appendiculatus]
MPACATLRALLWRRLFLQTIWRHYIALFTEVIFVVVTFAFFLHLDRVDLKSVRKLNSTVLENVRREPVDWSELDLTKVFVVYGPSNDRTDNLITQILGDSDDSVSYDDFYAEDTGDPNIPVPSYHDDTHKNPVTKLFNAVCTAAQVPIEHAISEDQVRVHSNSNTALISAPSRARAEGHNDIKYLKIGQKEIGLVAYAPAPENSTKEVIYYACSDETDEAIFKELKARNPSIKVVAARRLGTKHIVAVFAGTERPEYVSLTYDLVLPVPPTYGLPREVLRTVQDAFANPLDQSGEDVTAAIT